MYFLGAFAKLRRATISFLMSVRPHGTNWLPLDGFSLSLLFEGFSKVCRVYSSFIKIRPVEGVLYMKTNIHLFSYLAHFFLE